MRPVAVGGVVFGCGARVFAASIAALSVMAAACAPGTRGPSGQMRLDVLEGTARLTRGGETEVVGQRAGIVSGDRIVLSPDGIARLSLGRGRTFELEAASVDVRGIDALLLSRGSLLAEVEAPAEIDTEVVTVAGRGAVLRIDRHVTTVVGVYSGIVALRGAGQSIQVPAFRQAVIAGGILERGVQPLRLHGPSGDRWDRRFLQKAIELDARLANLRVGLEAQLAGARGLDFFRRVVPGGFDISFLGSFLDNRSSDLLIGLLVATEAGGRTGTQIDAVFREVFGLWSQGASWGLIALEKGVAELSLLDQLLTAIRSANVVAGGRGPGATRPPPSAPRPSPSPTPQPRPSPTPTEGPTPEPAPEPEPSPTPGVVEEVLEELLGILPPILGDALK